MKIENRITNEDVIKAIYFPIERRNEALSIINGWQLQDLKDKQATEAEFEIIEPKQLSKPD